MLLRLVKFDKRDEQKSAWMIAGSHFVFAHKICFLKNGPGNVFASKIVCSTMLLLNCFDYLSPNILCCSTFVCPSFCSKLFSLKIVGAQACARSIFCLLICLSDDVTNTGSPKKKMEFVGEQNSGSESDRALQKRLYELLRVNSILAIRQTTQI